MPRIKEIVVSPFEYPIQGQTAQGDTILVQEPGFDRIDVHNRCTHHVMNAIMGMQRHKFSEADLQQSEENAQGEDQGAEQILTMLAMGMADAKSYGELHKEMLQVLTNDAVLCRVKGSDAPMTDVAWRAIGISNTNRVMSVFLSFFLDQTASPSKNEIGLDSLTSSASVTAVDSIIGQPAVTRLGNSERWNRT